MSNLPHVTEILRFVGIAPEPPEYARDAMDRGTLVHKTTELYDLGQLDETTLDPALVGYLDGWKRFKKEIEVTIEHIELEVVNKVYGYQGRLDRIASISRRVFKRWPTADGDVILIDIKTGDTMPHYAIQTALYALAYSPANHIRRAAVFLDGEGWYAFHEYRDPHDYAVAKAAIQIYHWRKEHL